MHELDAQELPAHSRAVYDASPRSKRLRVGESDHEVDRAPESAAFEMRGHENARTCRADIAGLEALAYQLNRDRLPRGRANAPSARFCCHRFLRQVRPDLSASDGDHSSEHAR